MSDEQFDVIIIGGSYAGLSAAMSLGRALRNVLIIDSGKPCNAQTPHSHNFLTRDGQTPQQIAALAKEQVSRYTVQFYEGMALSAMNTDEGFLVTTTGKNQFTAKKLVFATGLSDQFPDIEGFAACWGISVIHCPYCHGYEVKNGRTGILANGDAGFEMARLISNWTKDLALFTNGESTLTETQTVQLNKHGIPIIEAPIDHLKHKDGYIEQVVFSDESTYLLKALYARIPATQHCPIPVALGCELNEQGLIKTDILQRTSVPGIYACGDNSQPARSVASSVATGSMAGAAVNKELIEELFPVQ